MKHKNKLLPKKKNTNAVYFKWLVAFSGVLTVVILSIMMIFVSISASTGKLIQEKSSIQLQYVKMVIDQEILNAQTIVSKTCLNENIQQLSKGEVFDEIRMLQLINELGEYSRVAGTSKEFFLLFRNSDLCLSPTGKYSREVFINTYVKRNGMFSNEDIEYFYGNDKSRRYIGINPYGKHSIAMVYFLRNIGETECFATVVVPFDSSTFNVEIGNTYSLQLCDNDEKIIFGDEEQSVDVTGEEMKILTGKQGSKKIRYMFLKSSVSEMKYAILTDAREYNKPLNKMKFVIVILCLFELILIILVLYRFIKGNYSEILRIINVFPHEYSGGNEFDAIYNYIHLLKSAQNKTDLITRKQHELLKYSFVANLVTSSYAPETLKDRMRNYGIDFVSDWFCVILYYVEDIGVMNTGDEKYREKDFEAAEFTVRNVVEEMASENGDVAYVTEVGGMFCCLMNFKDKQNSMAFAEEVARKSSMFFEEYFEFSLKISIGILVDGVENIGKSYKNAMKNLEMNFFDSDIICDKEDGSAENTDISQKIYAKISEGRTKEAIDIMKTALHDNDAKSEMYIGEIFKVIYDISKENDNILFDDVQKVFDAVQSKNVGVFEREAERIIMTLCGDEKLDAGHKTLLQKKIEKYISENYTDVNLSSQQVAEHFNMSQNYLLRFFKQNSGMGFLDYIHKLRIEKAKEILREENCNLHTMYTRCGYSNYNTFLRAFKKNTGITPQNYRDNQI